MQNSSGIPLAAFVAAIVLAGATIASVMLGVGGDPALNELQIGAAAWALTLAVFGLQGLISIVLEGRQRGYRRLLSAHVDPGRCDRTGHRRRPANRRRRRCRGRRLPRSRILTAPL
jgi:hypothetical protein